MSPLVETDSRRLRTKRWLQPRSIAIVGLTADEFAAANAAYDNLERFGYGGDVHLVSKKLREVRGRACVASIDELPEGIDVVLLCIPRDAVEEAVRSCVRRRAGSVTVFAAGFGEVDAQGRALQEEICRIAHAGGLLLAGPNCMGVINFVDKAPLTFEVINDPLGAAVEQAQLRPIGIVAQSGAIASIFRQALIAKGRSVSYSVTTGNEADIAAEDVVEAMLDGDRAQVVLVFAEQLRGPARFLALARRAACDGKHIVLLHPGRSERAQVAAASHTGAMTGDHAAMQCTLAYEGVVVVPTVEEAIDCAEMLSCFPPPRAGGVSVLTMSGALRGLCLDFAQDFGFDIPPLASHTVERLREILPSYAPLDNPLDVTAHIIREPSILGRSAQALLDDDAIGSLMVAIMPGSVQSSAQKLDSLRAVLQSRTKPLVVVGMGDEGPIPQDFAASVRQHGVPFFRSTERAMRTLGHVTALARRAALRHGDRESDVAAHEAHAPANRLIDGALSEHAGKALLKSAGIRIPRGGLAHTLAHASAVARECGYPVVLKAQAPSLMHKSDVGGVCLNIRNDGELEAAWQRSVVELGRRLGDRVVLEGALIEQMQSNALEMIVGARRLPGWGPVLVAGLGGVWAEVLGDVCRFPASAGRATIRAGLLALRGAALLQGARGQPARDIDALVDVIERVAALMRANPAIIEVDLNPVAVLASGGGAVALDALVIGSATSDT